LKLEDYNKKKQEDIVPASPGLTSIKGMVRMNNKLEVEKNQENINNLQILLKNGCKNTFDSPSNFLKKDNKINKNEFNLQESLFLKLTILF